MSAIGDGDATDALFAWLRARSFDREEIGALEALDLTAYLRETAHIGLDPGERLRRLAIALETELASSSMPRAFLALDRIYAEAVRLGSEEAETSLAISADTCVEHFPRTDRQRSAAAAILTKGEHAARRAIARRDDDALAHYALGSILYSGGHTASALAAFKDATTRDATMGWALLFRAHCLHDLKDWEEAVLAYDAVKASSFEGVIAWRYDLAREQRAFCLLMAGRRGEAIAAFETILARYEREPHLFGDFHDDLMAAADGALAPELGTRVAALLVRRR